MIKIIIWNRQKTPKNSSILSPCFLYVYYPKRTDYATLENAVIAVSPLFFLNFGCFNSFLFCLFYLSIIVFIYTIIVSSLFSFISKCKFDYIGPALNSLWLSGDYEIKFKFINLASKKLIDIFLSSSNLSHFRYHSLICNLALTISNYL